jgi:transcriptional regulator with XRE-family HTH domain
MAQAKQATTLGAQLRSFRLNSGLSQRELARRLGLRQPTISLIEHDRRHPSATLLRRIANALEIKPQGIFLLSSPGAKIAKGARLPSCEVANRAVWRAFTQDKNLLERYNVQPHELQVLADVRIIGRVHHRREFIKILTAIRHLLNDVEFSPS